MAEEGPGALKRTREFEGAVKWFVYAVALGMGLFHLYTAAFGILDTVLQRSLHLGFALVLIFVLYPASKKKPEKYWAVDLILVILSFVVTLYIWVFYSYITTRFDFVDPLTLTEQVLGVIIVLLVLESSRRTVGMPIVMIALFFLLYGLCGEYFPGTLKTPGFPFHIVIESLYLSTRGIYGFPIGISSTYIFLFILLGAFLQVSGVGRLFTDVAFALTGKTKGGPAKAAVVSSAFFGTIAGSATANVFATGSFTIPMMKQTGYKPGFAGAVEAAASCGGQFTPPVMGAAAFLVMEITGIPYVRICFAAALPALLYYWTMYWTIHFEADKMALGAMDMAGRPTFIQTMKRNGHLSLPLVALLAMLVQGYSPFFAAFWAVVFVPIVSFARRETWMGPRSLGQAIQIGVRNALPIVSACATAGIIMGIIMMTGVGFKFVDMVISISKEVLIFGLILTAIASLILGMGLPTTGAYILVAALAAPALVKMGISDLSSHMFVLYFAIISAITPPVALAAYAGASIAGSNMMKTGVTASRLGLAAFVLPYYFVYKPAILLDGTWSETVMALFLTMLALYLLSAGLEGWIWRRLSPAIRCLYLLAGILLVYPNPILDIAGIILGPALLVYTWLQSRREKEALTFKPEAVEPVRGDPK